MRTASGDMAFNFCNTCCRVCRMNHSRLLPRNSAELSVHSIPNVGIPSFPNGADLRCTFCDHLSIGLCICFSQRLKIVTKICIAIFLKSLSMGAGHSLIFCQMICLSSYLPQAVCCGHSLTLQCIVIKLGCLR